MQMKLKNKSKNAVICANFVVPNVYLKEFSQKDFIVYFKMSQTNDQFQKQIPEHNLQENQEEQMKKNTPHPPKIIQCINVVVDTIIVLAVSIFFYFDITLNSNFRMLIINEQLVEIEIFPAFVFLNFVIGYFIFDFLVYLVLKYKAEYLIHHIVAIVSLICVRNTSYGGCFFRFALIRLFAQFSTIFLNLYYIFKNKFCQIAFFVAFLICRICVLPFNLAFIWDHYNYSIFYLLSSTLIFDMLNIYWFILMIKKIKNKAY